MLEFQRSAKGFNLIRRPVVFGIFVKPGVVAIAGYTDDLEPSEIDQLCEVLHVAASEAKQLRGECRN